MNLTLAITPLDPIAAGRALLHELRNCPEVTGGSLEERHEEGSMILVHLSKPNPDLVKRYPEFAGHVVEFRVTTDPRFLPGETILK